MWFEVKSFYRILENMESTDIIEAYFSLDCFLLCANAWLCIGMQVLEWNGVLLTGKTYEEVQGLVGQPCNEAEVCVRL